MKDATQKLQEMVDQAVKPVVKRVLKPVKETEEQKQFRVMRKRKASEIKRIKHDRSMDF